MYQLYQNDRQMYQSLYNSEFLQSVTLKYGHLNNRAILPSKCCVHTYLDTNIYTMSLFHRAMAEEFEEGLSGQTGSC